MRFGPGTCLAALLVVTSARAESLAPGAKEPAPTRLRLFVAHYDLAAGADLDAATANGILAARLGRLGEAFTLVTQEEVKRALDAEALKQMLGADGDPTVLQQLGERINADRLLFGRLATVGATRVATLTLFDLKSGVVEKRVAGTYQGSADLAIARLNEQADQMLAYLFTSYAPDLLKGERSVAVKFGGAKKPAAHGPGWLTVAGGSLVGVGLGLAGGGVAAHAWGGWDRWQVPAALYGAGAAAAVAGGALLLLPAGE